MVGFRVAITKTGKEVAGFLFLFSCVIIQFMVLLEGKKIADEILHEIKKITATLNNKPRLGIVVVGPNPVIEKFIEQKKRAADFAGIEMRTYNFSESVTTNELRKRLSEIVHEPKNSGVVIQLPLPAHINTQYILNGVIPQKDVDMLSAKSLGNFIVGKSKMLPPVVGAVQQIFDYYKIPFREKKIVIAGAGNLVGRPVAMWLLREHVTFTIIDKHSPNPDEVLRGADVIISGMGAPRFITGDKVKPEVVIIDAGTSESEGKLVGDADFGSLQEKASFLTPVPGGIGPLTVAMLLKNTLTMTKDKVND